MPNITGEFVVHWRDWNGARTISSLAGAFKDGEDTGKTTYPDVDSSSGGSYKGDRKALFSANDGASVKGIYGNSNTVQPKSRVVYIYRRES